MKKTFKDFAEACWDTHKQVGFKTSSKTGKRVPNCVPKNEEGKDIPLSLYDLSELGGDTPYRSRPIPRSIVAKHAI